MSAAAAHAFVQAINRRDPGELASLVTCDHIFIDSLGNRTTGREQIEGAWRGYFALVPDYTITVKESFTNGEVVVMLGVAEGTYAPSGLLTPQNHWQTPAAWRAVIRGAQIAEWRIYADNEPIRKIMATNRT